MDAYRTLRVPLAVDKIDEIDEAIQSGVGGFRDRRELIAEAIDAYLLELKYGTPESAGQLDLMAPMRAKPSSPRSAESPVGVTLTDLTDCVTISTPGLQVTRAPLFGLHNRDFPSLWAAWKLAEMTGDRLISQGDFTRAVAVDAWKVGDKLRNLSARSDGPKLDALFPTNSAKPESSEDAFKSFAIGVCTINDGAVRCNGPLFLWNICSVEPRGDELYIGLTPAGKDLLMSIDGLSANIPHDPKRAEMFLRYIQQNAPEDWWGFFAVMKIAKSNPTREELLEHFRSERDHLGMSWSSHQIVSFATGYISRCREWGILEPKLLNGRYYLTEYGAELYVASVQANA